MGQRVKATCTVEIQVECEGIWGDDTTMKQLISQAEREARGRIERLFSDAGKTDEELGLVRTGSRGLKLGGVKAIVTQAMVEK